LAGTVTSKCVELKNVVGSGALPHSTVEPSTKPVPVTIIENAWPPGEAALGLRPVMLRGLMRKEDAADAGPLALMTVMFAAPVLLIKLAETNAVTCVEFTNAVGIASPFHCTVALERKPAPFTVRAKGPLPAVAELGLSPVMTGGVAVTAKAWVT
jgi:hypothetical protein